MFAPSGSLLILTGADQVAPLSVDLRNSVSLWLPVAAAAAISAGGFQIAAGVDHVDVCRVGRVDAHDRVAARAEGGAAGVDAEDAAPGLRGDARAALHDVQFGGDRPGGSAVGRAGHFVADAGGAAGVRSLYSW